MIDINGKLKKKNENGPIGTMAKTQAEFQWQKEEESLLSGKKKNPLLWMHYLH